MVNTHLESFLNQAHRGAVMSGYKEDLVILFVEIQSEVKKKQNNFFLFFFFFQEYGTAPGNI